MTGDVLAVATVPAPRADVFAFLARLENHWQLADRWIEVVRIDSDRGAGGAANGGAVLVHGPLGLSRLVRTRVVGVEPPDRIVGRAEVGARTRAAVTWELGAVAGSAGEGTRVSLRAQIERLGPLDAAIWALGGRLWMRRRLAAVLAGLVRGFVTPPAGLPAGPRIPG